MTIMISAWIKHRGWSALLATLVVAFGFYLVPVRDGQNLVGKDAIALDAIPNLAENQQLLIAEWPGHGPRDVQQFVSQPILSYLLGISGVQTVRGSAMAGMSLITIIFEDSEPFFEARNRISERLLALPDGLIPKDVHIKLGPEALPTGQVFWYVIEGLDADGRPSNGWDLGELRHIHDEVVRDMLLAVRGVAEVAPIGGFEEEIHIQFNPDRMAFLGLKPSEILHQLHAVRDVINADQIEINEWSYHFETNVAPESISDVEELLLVDEQGRSYRLGDIANVTWASRPRDGILDFNGRETVGGMITLQYGENPLSTLRRIRQKVQAVNQILPSKTFDDRISKLTIKGVYDRSYIVQKNLRNITRLIVYQLLLMLLVCTWFYQDIRPCILAGISLLSALFSVLILFHGVDYTLDGVALVGMAISIGSIVDISIIYTDSILQQSPDRTVVERVQNGMHQVFRPLSISVATTLLTFIPVFLLTGLPAKLLFPLALTKSLTIAIGFVLTSALSPVIFTAFHSQHRYFPLRLMEGSKHQTFLLFFLCIGLLVFFFPSERPGVLSIISWITLLILLLYMARAVIRNYEKLLLFWLRHKRRFALAAIFTAFMAIWALRQLPVVLLPQLNEGEFFLMPTSSAAATTAHNKSALHALNQRLQDIPEVDYAVGKIGRARSALDPAPMSMFEVLVHYKDEFSPAGPFSQGARNWRPHIRSESDIWQEIDRVVQSIPGITGTPKLQPIETRLVMLKTGFSAPLGLKILGQDPDSIYVVGSRLINELYQSEYVLPQSVSSDMTRGKPTIYARFDKDALRASRVRQADVRATLSLALGRVHVFDLFSVGRRLPTCAKFETSLDAALVPVQDLRIPTVDNRWISLDQVCEFDVIRGYDAYKNENRQLVQYVTFDKAPGAGLPELKREIESIVQTIRQKQSISNTTIIEVAGDLLTHGRAFKEVYISVFAVFVVLFLIFRLVYRSGADSLFIFLSILLSFAGGVIAIWLDYKWGNAGGISLLSWIGFLVLFGISCDDSVLLTSMIKDAYDSEKKPTDILMFAGKRRVRAIMLTTVTTILALLPVLFGDQIGSELLRPLAVPVIGGMSMSVFSIFTIPILYHQFKMP